MSKPGGGVEAFAADATTRPTRRAIASYACVCVVIMMMGRYAPTLCSWVNVYLCAYAVHVHAMHTHTRYALYPMPYVHTRIHIHTCPYIRAWATQEIWSFSESILPARPPLPCEKNFSAGASCVVAMHYIVVCVRNQLALLGIIG